MIRSNGLLSFNSSMNGGEFVQPHVQIREFLRYLLLLVVMMVMIDCIHALLCSHLFIYMIQVQIHIFLSNNIFWGRSMHAPQTYLLRLLNYHYIHKYIPEEQSNDEGLMVSL